jgi:hypothetical protein
MSEEKQLEKLEGYNGVQPVAESKVPAKKGGAPTWQTFGQT